MSLPEGHNWYEFNPLYSSLYQTNSGVTRLRRQVAMAFHDALPDSVAKALVDELLNAEVLGQKLQCTISSQVDPAIKVVLEAVKKLAVPYIAADGSPCLMVPVDRIDSLLK
jgi:hypothetical protein